jgi:hypothetical protein
MFREWTVAPARNSSELARYKNQNRERKRYHSVSLIYVEMQENYQNISRETQLGGIQHENGIYRNVVQFS